MVNNKNNFIFYGHAFFEICVLLEQKKPNHSSNKLYLEAENSISLGVGGIAWLPTWCHNNSHFVIIATT